MPFSIPRSSKLKVAIVGAGPSGLGAAIEFAKLPFVEWTLYERAPAVREVGAGISVQQNAWQMLELMNAAKNLQTEDFYRAPNKARTEHRNGRTGELLSSIVESNTPPDFLHARTQRSKLQQALLQEVDQSHIRLSHRLLEVSRLPNKKIKVTFSNGFEDEVDLLVGADGVKSVVRTFAFPSHKISYTGKTAYRTIVPEARTSSVPALPHEPTFWHGPTGWLYTSGLGGGMFEIMTMRTEADDGEKAKVSWGQEASVSDMRRHFEEFAPIAQEAFGLVTEVKEFALFAGPRLERVTEYGSVALIGDASHPLSGAFGAGAGFALEDAYTLAQSVGWSYERGLSLERGLDLFDKIRSPHYTQLYAILDQFAAVDRKSKGVNLSFDEAVNATVAGKWTRDHDWLYYYDAKAAFEGARDSEEAKLTPSL